MNYIPGKNLCDVINDLATPFVEKNQIITLLPHLFISFHTRFITVDGFLLHGDFILRNFIFKKEIWGFVFEEARLGKPIENIETLAASIFSTTPIFTDEKMKLTRTFIQTYCGHATWGLDNESDEIAYALFEQIQWRPDQENIPRRNAQRRKT